MNASKIFSQLDHSRIMLVQSGLSDAERAEAEKSVRDLIGKYWKLQSADCTQRGEILHLIDLLKEMSLGTGTWEEIPLSDDLRRFADASMRNFTALVDKCRRSSPARFRSFRAEVLMEPVIVLPGASPPPAPPSPSTTPLLNPTVTATAFYPVSGARRLHCPLHGLG